MIVKFNVPKLLVVASDETNTQFVSRANRTRAKKGSKKVRLIGVGQDKAQITITPTIVEGDGNVLAVQYIFGGTTDRCHPKEAIPLSDGFFCHTESHWQTPATMIQLCDKVALMSYTTFIRIKAHSRLI